MRLRFTVVVLAVLSITWGNTAVPWTIAAAGQQSEASTNASKQFPTPCEIPAAQKAVRFAVIGDSGTGNTRQYDVAQEMEKCREQAGFDFVLMLGDNIYGGKSQRDFERKFETPYKPLLDTGVKFYASVGNHDDPNERLYKPFNMGGNRYYSFKKGNATFFALDSNYMDSEQIDCLERQLQSTSTPWKICFFHHPLYSDGRYHGPDLDLRAHLAPIFQKYGVNLVFSGHDHVYERIKPKDGIYYFVIGNSGELRYGNLKVTADTAAGFDTDSGFLLAEIDGDTLNFQAISRTGRVVDSGALSRLQ